MSGWGQGSRDMKVRSITFFSPFGDKNAPALSVIMKVKNANSPINHWRIPCLLALGRCGRTVWVWRRRSPWSEHHGEDVRSVPMIGTFPFLVKAKPTNQPSNPLCSMKVVGRIRRMRKGSLTRVWKVLAQGRNDCSSHWTSYGSWGAGQLLGDSARNWVCPVSRDSDDQYSPCIPWVSPPPTLNLWSKDIHFQMEVLGDC